MNLTKFKDFAYFYSKGSKRTEEIVTTTDLFTIRNTDPSKFLGPQNSKKKRENEVFFLEIYNFVSVMEPSPVLCLV